MYTAMNNRTVLRQQRFLLSCTCYWLPRAYWTDTTKLRKQDDGAL